MNYGQIPAQIYRLPFFFATIKICKVETEPAIAQCGAFMAFKQTMRMFCEIPECVSNDVSWLNLSLPSDLSFPFRFDKKKRFKTSMEIFSTLLSPPSL
jgi:hypothetical protein